MTISRGRNCGRVQASHRLQPKVGAHAEHAHRDRVLERDGQEVGAGQRQLAGLGLGPGDGLLGGEVLAGILDAGQEPAVGNALGVEDQEGGGRDAAGDGSFGAGGADDASHSFRIDHDSSPLRGHRCPTARMTGRAENGQGAGAGDGTPVGPTPGKRAGCNGSALSPWTGGC